MNRAPDEQAGRRPGWAARALVGAKVALPVVCSLATVWIVKVVLTDEVVGSHAAEVLRRAGPWAPAIFVLLLAIRPVLLLPGQAFAALAGLLFGGAEGTLLSLAGCALGMGVVTTLGQRLLRRPVMRLAGQKSNEVTLLAGRHDLAYAVLVTLNPLLPTDVFVALGAAAGGRRWRLVLGSLIGSTPGTLATAYFGGAIAKGQPVLIAVTLAGVAASMVGGAWLARSAWRGLKAPAPEGRGGLARFAPASPHR